MPDGIDARVDKPPGKNYWNRKLLSLEAQGKARGDTPEIAASANATVVNPNEVPAEGVNLLKALTEKDNSVEDGLHLDALREGDVIQLTFNREGEETECVLMIDKAGDLEIWNPRARRPAECIIVLGKENLLSSDELKQHPEEGVLISLQGSVWLGHLYSNTILPSHALSWIFQGEGLQNEHQTEIVRSISVSRDMTGEGDYVPIALDAIDFFQPLPDEQIKPYKTLTTTFDLFEKYFADTIRQAEEQARQADGRDHTLFWESSRPGSNYYLILATDRGALSLMSLYDREKQTLYQVSKLRGTHKGESIYTVDVFEGIPDEETFQPERRAAKRRRYNFSNGRLNNTASYWVTKLEAEKQSLPSRFITAVDTQGEVEIIWNAGSEVDDDIKTNFTDGVLTITRAGDGDQVVTIGSMPFNIGEEMTATFLKAFVDSIPTIREKNHRV